MSNDYTFDATDAIGVMTGIMPIDNSGIGYVLFRDGDLQFGKFDVSDDGEVDEHFTPLSPRITPDRKDADAFYASVQPWLKKFHQDGFFKTDPLLIKWLFANYNFHRDKCLKVIEELEAKDK